MSLSRHHVQCLVDVCRICLAERSLESIFSNWKCSSSTSTHRSWLTSRAWHLSYCCRASVGCWACGSEWRPWRRLSSSSWSTASRPVVVHKLLMTWPAPLTNEKSRRYVEYWLADAARHKNTHCMLGLISEVMLHKPVMLASRPKFWPRPRPQTFGLDLASISLSYYVIGHQSGKNHVKFGNFANFPGNNLKSYVVNHYLVLFS